MVIKSIQLCNFGCYKGIQEPIVFSTDTDRNVTVILGANKSGKTTLVQAFLWGLYGTVSPKNGVINSEVKEAMSVGSAQTVFVEIVLIHADKEYTIRRAQRFTKANERIRGEESVIKVQYKEPSGEQQAITSRKDSEEAINNILPKGLSDYFFYEGERFDDISKKDVTTAVRGLMGLDAISIARDRLDPSSAKSVTSRFRKELKLGDAQESEIIKKKLANAQEERETIISRLEQAKEETDFYSRRKIELEAELSQYESVRQLQDKRKIIERDIAVLRGNVEQAAKRIASDFQKGALPFFVLPLISRAISAVENSSQDGEGIPEMRQAAIDHILLRKRCICGCDLNENEGAVRKIRIERNLLPPAHIGTLLHNIKQTMLGFQTSSSGYTDGISADYKNWRSNIRLLDSKEDDLKRISEEIAKVGEVNTAAIETDYQKTVNKISELTTLRERFLLNKGAIENTIKALEGKHASLVSKTADNLKIQKYIDYAEALFKWFDESYSRREAEVKSALNESVNRIFSEMYHGHRIVTIDDNYQIKLFATVGMTQEEIADTGGLRAVKNFAYITGLVDIARKKVSKKDNDADDNSDGSINATEAYPLVMDAPFSATDETHIDNISRIVPGIAEQVIIIVMQKDWVYAKSAIQDRIGKTYIIENVDNSETFSKIKEEH